MKPLLVLFSVFALSLLVLKLLRGHYDVIGSGRIALSVLLLFTASAHFVYFKGMAMMLPAFIMYREAIVFITGVIEIAAAIGLFIPGLRMVTGWLLILFFILLLPANVYAAIKQVDYQKGTYDGNGIAYLWFRVPLQILFMIWTYFTAIKA